MRISISGAYSVLCRQGLNRLLPGTAKRSPRTYKRYEKAVPRHQVQIDVKFLTFFDKRGQKIRRFQYTAIDNATRIRTLKAYTKHTQANAIKFLDYVISKFPSRIKYVQTGNGHDFQSKFHWHAEGCGLIHGYIKPASPHLNGKVERSHLTDKTEFYQLLKYKGDRKLTKKIADLEGFYNFRRPNGALHGKTPFEILKKNLVA